MGKSIVWPVKHIFDRQSKSLAKENETETNMGVGGGREEEEEERRTRYKKMCT